MRKRPSDSLKIELLGNSPGAAGVIDNFTSVEVALDLMAPSEASFELGDEGTWKSGASGSVKPGARYRVTLNGHPLLTGRVESNDVPVDAPAGAVVRFTIRTKLADAMFASADQTIAVKNATLRDFLLAVYAPLGYGEDSFVFDAPVGRNLRTGKFSDAKVRDAGIRIRTMKLEEARVSPPETIYSAADRHLRRFGLMHWDAPDDKIIVGYPDQGMRALYHFRARHRRGTALNNVSAATRSQDYSGLPSVVGVYGTSAARRDFSRSRVHGEAVDEDVVAAGFYRPVVIVAEQMLNTDAAVNSAWRELAMRRGQKDRLTVEVDGLSYWDGYQRVNYACDTMADYDTDVAGNGQLGRYYVTRAVMRRDARRGDNTHLVMLRAGLMALFPEAAENPDTPLEVANYYTPDIRPGFAGR